MCFHMGFRARNPDLSGETRKPGPGAHTMDRRPCGNVSHAHPDHDGLLNPADEETWRAFGQRYRPILVAFGRRLGLPPEDAADAGQETLVSFVKSYRGGKYHRERGRLTT